jgi:hypothetical protein
MSIPRAKIYEVKARSVIHKTKILGADWGIKLLSWLYPWVHLARALSFSRRRAISLNVLRIKEVAEGNLGEALALPSQGLSQA